MSVSFRLKEEDVEVSQTVCSHRSSRFILHSVVSSSLYEGSAKHSGQYSADSVASLASQRTSVNYDSSRAASGAM